MAKLGGLFSVIAQTRKHNRDLARLSGWMDETIRKIRKEYATLINEKGEFRRNAYGIDIDGSRFSKGELASIAKKIESLHDFCAEKDISLEIGGFDLLPHHYVVLRNGASSPYSVEIGLDAGQTYCGFTHPRAFKLSQAQQTWSKPRALPAPVPPPAAPVEAPPPVEVSTTREIIVRPIKLQRKPL